VNTSNTYIIRKETMARTPPSLLDLAAPLPPLEGNPSNLAWLALDATQNPYQTLENGNYISALLMEDWRAAGSTAAPARWFSTIANQLLQQLAPWSHRRGNNKYFKPTTKTMAIKTIIALWSKFAEDGTDPSVVDHWNNTVLYFPARPGQPNYATSRGHQQEPINDDSRQTG
jgi:hypothetical protein